MVSQEQQTAQRQEIAREKQLDFWATTIAAERLAKMAEASPADNPRITDTRQHQMKM